MGAVCTRPSLGILGPIGGFRASWGSCALGFVALAVWALGFVRRGLVSEATGVMPAGAEYA